MMVNSRRGSTLLEMVIVMALVAVMSAMIVSFSTLVQKRVNIEATNADLVQDLYNTQDAVECWISYFDNGAYTLSIQNGQLTACPNGSDLAYNINVEKGKITSQYPTGDKSFGHEYIIGLYFSSLPQQNGTKVLYGCVVTYIKPALNNGGQDMVETFVFTVSTRTGDVV